MSQMMPSSRIWILRTQTDLSLTGRIGYAIVFTKQGNEVLPKQLDMLKPLIKADDFCDIIIRRRCQLFLRLKEE